MNEIKWMVVNNCNKINPVNVKISVRGMITPEGISILKNYTEQEILKENSIETIKDDEIITMPAIKPTINKTIHNSSTALKNLSHDLITKMKSTNFTDVLDIISLMRQKENFKEELIINDSTPIIHEPNTERKALADRYKDLEFNMNNYSIDNNREIYQR
jgi:hypothetical protein